MENTEKMTWKEFENKSNKELKEKDAPYRLVPIWVLVMVWVVMVVLIAFLVALPVLIYNGKFQSIINNTISLEPQINNTVNNAYDTDFNPTTNNQYVHIINTTIYNNLTMPSINITCNCV